MDEHMIYIYIHDTNSSYLGIGYDNIKTADRNLFSKTMVG